MRDRGFVERLIRRAHDANCSALVLTLDLQIKRTAPQGSQERSLGTSAAPAAQPDRHGEQAALAPGHARHPAAWLRRHPRPREGGRGHGVGVGLDLRSNTTRPSTGTTSTGSAGCGSASSCSRASRMSKTRGMRWPPAPTRSSSPTTAAGSSMARSRPSVRCLPSWRPWATASRFTWTAAFASGQDVLRAVALGAKGTYIGRPMLYGLGALGEAGVSRALQIIHTRTRPHDGFLRAHRRRRCRYRCAAAGHLVTASGGSLSNGPGTRRRPGPARRAGTVHAAPAARSAGPRPQNPPVRPRW